jgi:fatty-acyl-CoA synthase
VPLHIGRYFNEGSTLNLPLLAAARKLVWYGPGDHTVNSEPTLQGVLERACEKYASNPLVTVGETTIKYGEAWRRAGQLANSLANAGVEPGDRVGLLSSNRIEYVVADFACVRGGFVKVALNDMLSDEEIQHIVTDSGATAVVVEDEFLETIQSIRADNNALEHIVGITSNPPDDVISFDDCLAKGESNSVDANVTSDDLSMFQYTGGTTGKPKGSKHTQFGLAMDLHAHVIELEIGHEEQMLLTTPLPHSAGYAFLAGMLRGAHVVVTDGFDPGEFLELVETDSITWTWMVPTMLYRILDHDQLSETDVSSLETLVYGAAPITRERLEEGLEAFGQVFIQLYGQSEIPNIGTTLQKADHDLGAGESLESCGRAATMVDVRIAPLDTKSSTDPVPIGEEGEILLRAPYAMVGYHKLPDATEQTIVDGWIRTGDVGKKDENGYVYILDRDKDVIVSGGMNVYTTTVEDALDAHDGVTEVAVIGIPHDDWGESVHAVIVPAEFHALTEDEILSFADEALADYKKPKSVEFVEKLPTTPYGKVDKKVLREPYWKEADRNVA